MSTTREQREAAAQFYLKDSRGLHRDWIEDGEKFDGVDDDVFDLAEVFAEREAALREQVATLTAELERRPAYQREAALVADVERLTKERDEALSQRAQVVEHMFWGAGESDCPRDIKAANGELHTLRCKRCGGNGRKPCTGNTADYAKKADDSVVVDDETKDVADRDDSRPDGGGP